MEIDVSKLDVLKKQEEESKLDQPINIYKNFTVEKEQPKEPVIIPIVKQQEDPPEDPLVVIQRTFVDEVCKAPDSIIDTIDTGNPVVVRKKKKVLFATPLFKETFLSEFRSEQEKKKARENLGIYSKGEIDNITTVLKNTLERFVSRESLDKSVTDLNFVKAKLVKSIIYNIPTNI